eukprot:CAMPEP_0114999522 /NCGR_PEP_ID=MMETSP0216-20121206/16196_1 /TAXON_ID=223996 /ORGANISM="Protocruzia adherens, Strain Boccale" /LENGTH=797 /DNA_ID=CAMNT_0002364413 /DNA_START=267 /DNA_END=2660 /DNA_ORIENTATION=-
MTTRKKTTLLTNYFPKKPTEETSSVELLDPLDTLDADRLTGVKRKLPVSQSTSSTASTRTSDTKLQQNSSQDSEKLENAQINRKSLATAEEKAKFMSSFARSGDESDTLTVRGPKRRKRAKKSNPMTQSGKGQSRRKSDQNAEEKKSLNKNNNNKTGGIAKSVSLGQVKSSVVTKDGMTQIRAKLLKNMQLDGDLKQNSVKFKEILAKNYSTISPALVESLCDTILHRFSTDSSTVNKPWYTKYRPESRNEFHDQMALKLIHSWLTGFQKRIARKQKRKQRDLMCLIGVNGSNRVAPVYIMAKELGLRVIEVNSLIRRTGLAVLKQISEATQSRRIHSITELARADLKKETAAPTKNYSKKVSKLAKDMQANLNIDSKTVIVFKDVDYITEDDKGFFTTIDSLSRKTKCPIILTSERVIAPLEEYRDEMEKVEVQTDYDEKMVFLMHAILELELQYKKIADATIEGLRVDRKFVEHIYRSFNYSIKEALSFLQFWIANEEDTSTENLKRLRRDSSRLVPSSRYTNYDLMSVSGVNELTEDMECKLFLNRERRKEASEVLNNINLMSDLLLIQDRELAFENKIASKNFFLTHYNTAAAEMSSRFYNSTDCGTSQDELDNYDLLADSNLNIAIESYRKHLQGIGGPEFQMLLEGGSESTSRALNEAINAKINFIAYSGYNLFDLCINSHEYLPFLSFVGRQEEVHGTARGMDKYVTRRTVRPIKTQNPLTKFMPAWVDDEIITQFLSATNYTKLNEMKSPSKNLVRIDTDKKLREYHEFVVEEDSDNIDDFLTDSDGDY